MKIVLAEVQSTRITTSRPHQMAIGTTSVQEDVVVKLVSDEGLAGWGEAPHMVGHSQRGETPATVRVVLRHKLLPAVLGMDPLNQEAMSMAMDRAVPWNTRAKGSLIMAAYDLAGKALGTPVYNLLGGKVRDRIPLSWSLPIQEPAVISEEAQRMVARGWRILKVKIGRPDPMQDVAAVRAVRKAVGDSISIRADANQAYDVKTAIKVARHFEELGLDFLEQPVSQHNLEGLAEVTHQVGVPIMADESAQTVTDLLEIVKHRAADYVSIYVIGPGGLHNSKRMATLAQAAQMRAYVGGALESIIGASAGLHFAAASPSVDLGCEMSGQFLLTDDFGKQPIRMEDGALVVPTEPGLGVDIDEEKLARHRDGEIETFAID
jgi:muconate cycloisomerase